MTEPFNGIRKHGIQLLGLVHTDLWRLISPTTFDKQLNITFTDNYLLRWNITDGKNRKPDIISKNTWWNLLWIGCWKSGYYYIEKRLIQTT